MNIEQTAQQLRLAADILETGHPWERELSQNRWGKTDSNPVTLIQLGIKIRLALSAPWPNPKPDPYADEPNVEKQRYTIISQNLANDCPDIVAPVVEEGAQDRPTPSVRWVKSGPDMLLEGWCHEYRKWVEVPFVLNAHKPA